MSSTCDSINLTGELKPYPAMKDSGVEWLGEIPAHWELPRLGALLQERGEMNSNGHVGKVLSVLRDRGVIPYSEKGNIGNKMSEDITRYKVVRPNDIVVNCMNVIIGSVGLSRYTGCLSPVYYVLTRRSEDDDPQYLNAYFQTKPFQESLVRIGNGILAHRMRIPMELLKCEIFPRPPTGEQTAIVRFLDHADRRIRRYIRAKQKLIALLEEQKQAIIHQAVTGQIDVRTGEPYPAYKDSGVKWLGDVPKHWEVRPFTRIAIEKADYRGATPTKKESGVFLVTAKNIRKGWIDYEASQEFVAEEEYPNIMRRGFPRQGDMLLTTEAPLGHAALVDREDIALAQRVIRFRLSSGILLSEFALHSVLDWYFQNQLMCRGTGSTALGIKASKLPQLKILCPPLNEQHAILGQVAEVQGRIDCGAQSGRPSGRTP